MQRLVLGFVSLPGVIVFIVNFLLSVFTLLYYKLRSINFLDAYIKLISALSAISIPFWLFNQISYYGIDLVNVKSLGLYTSFPRNFVNPIVRNSGMFWEPGAFAGYLIVGLAFIILRNKRLSLGEYKLSTILIVLGIVSSMSTTGYVLLGIMFSLYSVYNFKWGKVIIVPVCIVLISWTYNELNFLQDKIEQQFIGSQNLGYGEVSNTRFGTVYLDAEYILANPIIGNGLHEKTRFRFHPWMTTTGFGNGFTDFIADWGLILFAWWIICVYDFARKQTNSIYLAIIYVSLFFLVLQGEQFLNFPFFMTFFILPIVNQRNI
ncbi:MAG: hypothetical protein JJ958_14955 [Balneola sp.]|nr:hypothetical protein [Balneola sp.]